MEKSAAENQGSTFEMKLVRRVRFRKEKMTANYILNHEFDQSIDIIRQYVQDYNYKLILATFDALKEDGMDTGMSGRKIDFKKMKVHLNDNYLRSGNNEGSIVDKVLKKVKVEDDIQSKKKEEDSEINTDNEKNETKTNENNENSQPENKNK